MGFEPRTAGYEKKILPLFVDESFDKLSTWISELHQKTWPVGNQTDFAKNSLEIFSPLSDLPKMAKIKNGRFWKKQPILFLDFLASHRQLIKKPLDFNKDYSVINMPMKIFFWLEPSTLPFSCQHDQFKATCYYDHVELIDWSLPLIRDAKISLIVLETVPKVNPLE